jgi:hypothetical protein
MARLRVAIAGGGISELTVAIALLWAGPNHHWVQEIC